MNVIYQHQIDIGGVSKTIRLINDDMSKTDNEYDVVACSAFKGDYSAAYGTLIGALLANKGINVRKLSNDCQLDFKEQGGWLSKELNGNFKRIVCVEIVDVYNFYNIDHSKEIRGSFSTLRFLLEQTQRYNIPLRKLALPVLGTGHQMLEIEYVVPPLITNIMGLFQSVENLETVDIYEINVKRANRLKELLQSIFGVRQNAYSLFISHSHCQADVAHNLAKVFSRNNIRCWIAPDSIPAGSNYLNEIASALANSYAILLVLTPDAEKSEWVLKELESAVSSKIPIIPCIVYDYPIGATFRFVLAGCQQFRLDLCKEGNFEELIKAINQKHDEVK